MNKPMTQEEKDLLLKDLCARLPYGMKYQDRIEGGIHILTLGTISHYERFIPYLRSMSSMTVEERDEIKEICADYLDEWENAETVIDRWKLDAKTSYSKSAFCNSHHLDWNGLIEKGLALEAPEGMYNIKYTKTEQGQIEELAELKRKLSK